MASGAWHGLGLRFITAFILQGMLAYIMKIGDKTQLANLIVKTVPSFIIAPVKLCLLHFFALYNCLQFIYFSKSSDIAFYHSNLYYVGHWASLLLCIVVTVLPKVRSARSTDAKIVASEKEEIKGKDSVKKKSS